jgi:hypothetical protein
MSAEPSPAAAAEMPAATRATLKSAARGSMVGAFIVLLLFEADVQWLIIRSGSRLNIGAPRKRVHAGCAVGSTTTATKLVCMILLSNIAGSAGSPFQP